MSLTKQDGRIGLGLFILAAAIRFYQLDQLGLTHFDEGSYAMTGRWLATFGREGWIYQPIHAPGLFATIIGVFFLLFGVHDTAAIAVSALAGSVTVSVLYFAGRIRFGVRTALLAALLLATTEYHLIYSRMALTDALFTLLFLTAVSCFFIGLQNGRRVWFILGGLATGLCWLTKYHGFFPLLITGGWLGASTIWHYYRGQAPAHSCRMSFAYGAVIAVLLYLPWFLFVQLTTGYGPIISNTLTHSLGSGQVVITSPGVLLFYLGRWLTPGLLGTGLIGIITALFNKDVFSRHLIFVLGTMLLAALLYFSFPRLVLPIIPVFCLLGAAGIQYITSLMKRHSTALFVVFGAGLVAWNLFAARPVLNQSTDAYARAGAYMRSLGCVQITQMSKNYYFYEDEPSIEMRKHSIATLDSMAVKANCLVIAVDPIIERLPEYKAWFEGKNSSYELVRTFDIEMYETNYYQGVDPRRNDLPLSQSPFIPGAAKIRIYRQVASGL